MRTGEDRLALALEKALKSPWAIYRNVAWPEKRPGDEPADGEADIVVAHPDLGVMVIEVKGGRVGRIATSAARMALVSASDNGSISVRHPRHEARLRPCPASRD